MGKRFFNKKSFKYRLIVYFCLLSIIPIIVMNIISYYNTSNLVQENVDDLTDINLAQTKNNVNIVLSSYEDLLYQMYTDDAIVDLVDKIDTDQDLAVSRNQLRRTLRGLASVKPYIQCITVITNNGTTVFYDKLASPTANIKWLNNYGISPEQILEQVAESNQTEILPTKYAAHFNSDPYYLFHMAHRIIDYKNINRITGIVILSIDERMLYEICNQNAAQTNTEERNSLNFIINENGSVISFMDASKIGTAIIDPDSSGEEKEKAYIQLVRDSGAMTGEYMKVYSTYDETLHWSFIDVSNQSNVLAQMNNQQRISVFVLALSVLALVVIIIFITNRLTGSIGKVVKAMKAAEKGELSTRVEEDDRMPIEIETIAKQFNQMIEKLNDSIENEKTANEKQKNAEISALEAQINPHFLYNTLDTINWMAIDKDQYEISNAINSLANILRYGVDKSNSVVAIKQEVDWLKQYVFLQQTRLKNTFELILHVESNVLEYHIHKLLLQPFVENAILHGFEGAKKKCELKMTISEAADTVRIVISDNGKGMTEEMVAHLNSTAGEGVEGHGKVEAESHIGISNAIGRLHMYYGAQAKVRIESQAGEGTSIYIEIPKI